MKMKIIWVFNRDREAVLRRADYLKKCNMSVSEDFSKSVREQRMHLAK